MRNDLRICFVEISIQFFGRSVWLCGRRRCRLMFNKKFVGFVEWKWRALVDIKQLIFEQRANANERKTKCALINYRPANIRLHVAQSRSDLRQYMRPQPANTHTHSVCGLQAASLCCDNEPLIRKLDLQMRNECAVCVVVVVPCRMRKFICVNFATARLTIIPFAVRFRMRSQFDARQKYRSTPSLSAGTPID